MIDETGFVLIVECRRITEASLRAGRIEPRFALSEGAAGKREGLVRILRRSKRNQVDGAAEGVAAVRILRPETFADLDAGKRSRWEPG